MKIDAHQHFWSLARGDYGWLDHAPPQLQRDFAPGDLEPLLRAQGITGTILVQAAPTEGETDFLLDIARGWPLACGVVGWAPLDDAGAPAAIARLAREPLLVGLRPMLHDLEDPRWVLRPRVLQALRAMAEAGLVFDALVRPVHLPHVHRLAIEVPDLKIVIDHAAKPRIADQVQEPWRSDIERLAALPRVSCKLSGLLTEAGADLRAERLRPYVDHVLRCFGPRRVLWGSDWPVLTLAASYGRWCELTTQWLAHLAEPERALIWSGNAAAVYLGGRGREARC